ncbi:hypothetical protein FJV41_43500 [Myxococcus llanfairpwllgwyngyllgogerychwyrndrobwllllantysiliogogogochensis]|uniref:Uncharacterized protein n=1 Tax=Myxococcus llanfairpwllgwyngyllgogerychwyrndrobwllllantysiliogogogochensis TaxID=2590453 RepID=A0A540WKU5_9BACT|nr:hypothetical protein FJV41_43500 [Myxococcus llanfairpwllgwyngyllgogerychwyrndrobwllllantysiliogogogochensis]
MDTRRSNQHEVEVSAAGRSSTPQQRQDDAVDVLADALWELWLRRHAQRQGQAPAWSAEESAHG